MYIQDDKLRSELKLVLLSKTKNQIVKEIKEGGERFHQYHIDRFLSNKPISIETLKKIEKYILKTKSSS
jgi:hypothetical protein